MPSRSASARRSTSVQPSGFAERANGVAGDFRVRAVDEFVVVHGRRHPLQQDLEISLAGHSIRYYRGTS